jgi:CHAT domain-containing protein
VSTLGPCPIDSDLAAVAGGGLDSIRRGEVIEHALRCPKCKDVMAAIADFHEELSDANSGTSIRRIVAVAAGIVLAIAGSALGISWWRSSLRSTPGTIEQLARAAGERRLASGRLSGGFSWAPSDRDRGEKTRGSENWDIAGIASQLAGTERADAHALGIAHLLLGNADEAVRYLEQASREAPQDPAVWSDLAAALIERGKAAGSAEDLVRGLDAAGRALGLKPGLPLATFNRALALEELGLREAAIEAWEDYQRIDPDSDWSKEARARAEKLRAAPIGRSWSEDAPAFESACAAGDRPAIDELVRRHPQQSSEALMAALGAWGELALAGDSREAATLERVERGARSMAAIVGDPLVEIAASEIRAAASNPTRRRRLAEAHVALARGRAALDDARAEEAGHTLQQAVQRFRELGAPYGDLAELYRLSSTYYVGAISRHLAELEALLQRYPADQRRIVGARARWLRGLAIGVSGQPLESVTLLGETAANFEALGFEADATFVRSIEATMWWTLGQTARAWDEHRVTFRRLERITDPRRAQALMSQAASEAGRQGYPLAALDLQQVAVALSRRHDTAMDKCDGLIWLARAAARAGRMAFAEGVARDARLALGRVEDPSFKARLDAELSLVEGRLSVDAEPERAIEAADRAAKWLESVGKENQMLEAYRLRAHARASAGDASGASRDYLLALDTAERQRDRLDESSLRASFFETTWELARDLVGFELERGNTDGALQLAERIRATSLSRPKRRPSDSVDGSIASVRRGLKSDQAVVFYSVLEDRTIAWVIRSTGVRMSEIPVPERELADDAASARRALTSGTPAEALAVRRQLFVKLIDPLRVSLSSVRTVIIVPDGSLHSIPWGALVDSRSGRPWVDEVAVAVTSALRCIAGTRRERRDAADLRAVTVGDPDFDRALYRGLPRLPGAAREAREIGALYKLSAVLLGPDATADRLLAEVAHADVLHVAAHALSNPIDPDLSTIVLAPGGAVAPTGGLTAREIRGRPMDQLRLVVLAACRTGDGRPSRMEGPLNLARPFLENGVSAVVVSLWDLPDEAGASFMGAFHDRLHKGEEPIDALQHTTSACWASPGMDPRVCGGLQLVINEPVGR